MGTNLSVYSYNPEGYIAIKSVKVDDKISLSMFGFDDDYKDYFKTATKDKVKGEPLGVTADYDTVDYKYNKDKTASEVELVDDNSTIPGAQNWKYGVLALAGIVVAAGLVICILLARKKKEK